MEELRVAAQAGCGDDGEVQDRVSTLCTDTETHEECRIGCALAGEEQALLTCAKP
jgi:hypothetical protein